MTVTIIYKDKNFLHSGNAWQIIKLKQMTKLASLLMEKTETVYDPNVIRAKRTTSPISTLAKMCDLNL